MAADSGVRNDETILSVYPYPPPSLPPPLPIFHLFYTSYLYDHLVLTLYISFLSSPPRFPMGDMALTLLARFRLWVFIFLSSLCAFLAVEYEPCIVYLF